MEQVREEFEVYAKLEGFDVTRHKGTGFYIVPSTHKLWKAWLASRELYQIK